jgi:hypothetical protein
VFHESKELSDLLNIKCSSVIALMMETVTSETSVNFYQTTRRNIQEDTHLQLTLITAHLRHVYKRRPRGKHMGKHEPECGWIFIIQRSDSYLQQPAIDEGFHLIAH